MILQFLFINFWQCFNAPTIIQNQYFCTKEINQISFQFFSNGSFTNLYNKHKYHVQLKTKFSPSFCLLLRTQVVSLCFSTWPFPQTMLRLFPKPVSLPSPPSKSHQNPRISIWVDPNSSALPSLAMSPNKFLPYVTSTGEKTILQLCRGRTPWVGSGNLAESTSLKPFYPLLPSLSKRSIPSQTMKISRFVIINFQ